MRKTKIIATIGPATRNPDVLEQLLLAGMDCARLNFSHGTLEEHAQIIRDLRRLSNAHQRPLAILQDLGGIKLRLGEMRGTYRLETGDSITLTPEVSSDREDALPFPHPEILSRLGPGAFVYISDGTICLEVIDRQGSEVRGRVTRGGLASSFKGVNVPGLEMAKQQLLEQDKIAIRFGVEHQVDWLAVSFVQTAEDIREVKGYLAKCGGSVPVMAKLEKAKALENLEEILQEADAVMVARGDLGVEMPMAKVPVIQKEVVRRANELTKPSVIATQMLRSMMVSPIPTRAEVSDIANAVLDGCDAILLSDETAIGEYPVDAVKVADETIREAEHIYPYFKELPAHDRTQALTSAASTLTNTLKSLPIVVTSTGRTALELSRYRPQSDILVLSHDEATLRKLSLGWGLVPIGVIHREKDIEKLVAIIVKAALESGLVKENDKLTIVHGHLTGVSGTTNTVQVLDLSEYLSS